MKQKSLELYNNSKIHYLIWIIIFIILVYFFFSYFSMINEIEGLVVLKVNYKITSK
jgi:hypothetical protein